MAVQSKIWGYNTDWKMNTCRPASSVLPPDPHPSQKKTTSHKLFYNFLGSVSTALDILTFTPGQTSIKAVVPVTRLLTGSPCCCIKQEGYGPHLRERDLLFCSFTFYFLFYLFCIPAHGRGVGSRWSLRSLTTQGTYDNLWFHLVFTHI